MSRESSAIGGLLSAALSVGSRRPGITRHRISVKPGLSSPFKGRGHPAFWHQQYGCFS